MKKVLLFFGFVLGNFSILLVAILALTVYTTKDSAAAANTPLENILSVSQSSDSYNASPKILGVSSAMIVAKDGRADILDNYFKKYNSPMAGLGSAIVESADRHKIPFGYLAAIGQCEGNLGKTIPHNSYNTWGWGIYGNKVTRFDSYDEAIDTISRGIKKYYIDKGLTTPEDIMRKYTPPSDGSWAYGVNTFLKIIE